MHSLIRTSIVALAGALLAPAASAQDSAAAPDPDLPGYETIQTAQLLLDAEATGEIRKGPKKILHEQIMIYAGDAILELGDAERKAFLDRHGMESSAPLFLAHHLRIDMLGATRHVGWLFCAINTRMFKGQAVDCLRDTDDDRRFDSIASFEPAKPASLALSFAPIEPVPYRYSIPSQSPPESKRRHIGGSGRLSIEYDFDAARGLLLVRNRARASFYGMGINYPLEPVIEVDPKSLPTEIEIAGAKLRLLAWDGKALTASIVTPMTRNPVLLVAPPGRARMPIGKVKGHRLLIVDAVLPASAP